MVVRAGEVLSVVYRDGAADTVVPASEHDRWNGDLRLLRDQVFESLVLRVALDESITVAVGVDYDVNEVGVVKTRGAGGKRLGCATPRR